MTLPENWTWKKIGEVATTTSGGTPSRKHQKYFGGNIPWIKSGELGDGLIFDSEENITEEGIINSNAKIFPAGTVLVALYGATVGKVGILQINAATNQAVCAIFPRENTFTAKYMFYWLLSQRHELINKSIGGAQPNISQGIIRTYPFPQAPLPEQERIVARIEELFTQLEAGVASLRRVQAALNRYRASVLKAACEGRLVPQDPNDETTIEQLHHIWSQRNKKMPTVPFNTDDLPDQPSGWNWSCLEQLVDGSKYSIKAGPFGSSIKKEFYVPKGYKIYGQEQVIRNDPYYGDYYIDQDLFEKLRSCEVKPGDILISLVGTIGKVLILPDDIEPGIINPRLVKLSLSQAIVDSRYIKIFLESDQVGNYFSIASHGQTMDVLNLGILKRIPIALPPLNEQKRIVVEVNSTLSVIEQIEVTVEAGFKRAERLRQAILKRAFEGKLVPQNPEDEPDGKLLDLIKAEQVNLAKIDLSNQSKDRSDKIIPEQLDLF